MKKFTCVGYRRQDGERVTALVLAADERQAKKQFAEAYTAVRVLARVELPAVVTGVKKGK